MYGKLECSIITIMKTILEKIDKNQNNTDIIREAGRILKEGGLVAFPTETVYGLGADALNEDAAKKIYAAKGRPSDNPLIIHITNMKALEKIVSEVPEKAVKVAEKYWPGPLTMIFNKSDIVPYGTTGGLDTVAVRMPVDAIAREVIGRRIHCGTEREYFRTAEPDNRTACSRRSYRKGRHDRRRRGSRDRGRIYNTGYDGRTTDDLKTGSHYKRDVRESDRRSHDRQDADQTGQQAGSESTGNEVPSLCTESGSDHYRRSTGEGDGRDQ